MSEIVYREMRPEDVRGAVALRNEVFANAPVTEADWVSDGMLASIAVMDGEVVGAIPLDPRELVIAPGVTVRAPFENSVGTRESLRSRGVGAGMISAARDFMRDRADGLFVYRGDERSRGYRFYTRTGHHDLMYTRRFRLASPRRDPPPGEVVSGVEAISALGDEMMSVFLSTYGAFGGYPRRHEGYWAGALRSSIFAEFPTDFHLVCERRDGVLAGYAILGVPKHSRERPAQVMDMATLGADLGISRRLIERSASLAAYHGRELEVAVSVQDPFVPALVACGFSHAGRGTILMAQLLEPPRLFDECWRERFELGGVGLSAWTECSEHVLIEPERGNLMLTLEMKEEVLHRWLLARADLAARLREGSVTARGVLSPLLVERVCATIPLVPWAFHFLDWI